LIEINPKRAVADNCLVIPLAKERYAEGHAVAPSIIIEINRSITGLEHNHYAVDFSLHSRSRAKETDGSTIRTKAAFGKKRGGRYPD
jgi:hypothetical protein